MQFRGKDRPPTPEIAAKLNVDAFIEGSVSARRRHGADHRAIDRRAGRQAPVGQDLRAQLPRCAGASDRTRVGDRAGSERAAHAERAVAAGRRAEPGSRGARRISQGPLLLQSAKRRQSAKGDRAIRGGGQVEPEFSLAFSGMSDAYLWAGYNEGFLTATAAKEKAGRGGKGRAAGRAAPPKRIRRWPSSSCSTGSTGRDASGNSGGRSRSTRTTRSRTISSAWHSRFRDGSRRPSPKAQRAIELDPLSPQILIDATMPFLFQRKLTEAKAVCRERQPSSIRRSSFP